MKRTKKKAYVEVEYSADYSCCLSCGSGPDREEPGDTVLIPAEDTRSEKKLFEAFIKKTTLCPCHIIHYSPDELVDENGDPLED